MPASLRPDTPIGMKYADDTWHAISTANDWGRCVLDALGDHTGAVLEDTALRHLVWFVPPGGVDGWPTPEPLRLTLYRAGDSLLVPRLNGYRGVNVWLRTPKANGLFTDPNTLRSAMERLVGPLEQAAGRSPVVVCHFCAIPTRDAQVIDAWESFSTGAHVRYACHPCLSATGGGRVHLLTQQQDPQ
ncbi:hypothetical protein PS467_09560 [Streptomyces luomodiensis]|uniref:Uncharacterized protein n=1 Tax=Streptomyces luomodiensis TaxID=3026192 RepID=A0ABY9USM0_9ACTN|nr:hypothetical protein [Streptomyces sp. SCA4-21]WNE95562.1 hypothetical protein PS467_09560 [Streptomyces sp. SCA4-21]